MTPASKEGLPAVVGELVAEMRDAALDCSDADAVHTQLRDWADRLSALTAEAGKGEACAWIIENTTVGPGEPANIVDWHEKDIDKLPVGTKLYAALSTATPAGEWVLVPKEPTDEMLRVWLTHQEAAGGRSGGDTYPWMRALRRYQKMLAASPRGAGAGEG
jgi:hypothetical protein